MQTNRLFLVQENSENAVAQFFYLLGNASKNKKIWIQRQFKHLLHQHHPLKYIVALHLHLDGT